MPGLQNAEATLHLIARLAYQDDLPQQQIAQMFGISQAKVSRLLAQARACGIVRISVREHDARQPELEARLRDKYGLAQAIVFELPELFQPEEKRRLLGLLGAPVLAGLIPPRAGIGLAGGRTIRQLVLALARHELPAGLTVAALMGNMGHQAIPSDAAEIGRQLAEIGRGSFLSLNTPVYISDRQTRDALAAEAQIKAVFAAYRRLDLALIGVGTLENSFFQERDFFTAEQLAGLRRAGAVGEICGRFFAADGRECATEFRGRVLGIERADLARIKQAYALTCGADRVPALAAALRGGWVNSLLIDHECAQALLHHSAAVGKER